MHAVVVTVEIDADRADEARELLETFTIPTAKGMPGFISGSWMRSADKTRGTGVVILDSEDAANALAGRAAQGPPEGAPVRFVSAEVLEVCHAHVWTGGAWSWLLAQPMSGSGPVLGLVVRVGELWSYSIESRNSATGSNVRGHVIAQVTDYARNPTAFGGQPQIVLEPGSSYTPAWDIGFHPDVDDFLEATEPPVVLDRLGAPIGHPIVIRSDRGIQEVHGTEHGVAYVDIPPRSRTAVLFHLPLRELSERRIRHLIDRQRPLDPAAYLSPFPPP